MKLTKGELLIGGAGTATEVIFTREPDDDAAFDGTLATWFLECPGQSPAWQNYMLSVIHLREIEGAKSAHIHVPGATHEVILAALDPAENPTPLGGPWKMLRPINLMEQVRFPTDRAACDALRACARNVVEGSWLWCEPPLSGQTEPWRTALRILEYQAQFEGWKP